MMRLAILLCVGAHGHPQLAKKGNEKFDPNHILCPVLASMWSAGDLKTDEEGDVELDVMYDGLVKGIGTETYLAEFQARGITDFDRANNKSNLVRDRCLPGFTLSGSECAVEKKIGVHPEEVKRWFSPFRMNGKQVMEHGISTGTRGGATNVPDPEMCGGQFPCEARFQRFYAKHADTNGRLYRKNIMGIICEARKSGDRGGEYSYSSGSIHLPGGGDLLQVPAREWQMKAAMSGWLAAFGRTDDHGEWYIHIDDARAMVMEGRYPDGWKKRDWGCLASGCDHSFMSDSNQDVPCDVDENGEWWQDYDCKVATGKTCELSCDGGATCVEGKCVCGHASNTMGMCWKNGQCVERTDKCTYFGEKCTWVPATNPTASGNPSFVSNATSMYV